MPYFPGGAVAVSVNSEYENIPSTMKIKRKKVFFDYFHSGNLLQFKE